MLTLRLEHPLNDQVHVVGPAPFFRIEGPTLFTGPDKRQAAVYRGGFWQANGNAFLTLTPEAPVRVEFIYSEPQTAGPHGPFEELRVVDGAIRHGPRLAALLARFDERMQAWYVCPEARNSPVVILSMP